MLDDVDHRCETVYIEDWGSPRHGALEVALSATEVWFTYRPNGFVGTDRVAYAIGDAHGGFDAAVVDLVVGAPQAGTDLDLHLLDATNGGTYFDPALDTYWQNRDPTAGSDASGTPQMNRDDTDGDGPENIDLAILPPDRRFCVGVHVWDDFGLGASYATVRVYLDGELRFEGAQRIVRDDLWEVGCIAPESGFTRTVAADGGAVVLHDYPRP